MEVILEKGKERRRVRLEARTGVATVGRHPTNTLQIDEANISRTHFRVQMRESRLYVEDTSTNGTTVGGNYLHRATTEVAFGTPILVGDYSLRFLNPNDPPSVEVADQAHSAPGVEAPTPAEDRSSVRRDARPAEAKPEARPDRSPEASVVVRAANVALRKEIHKRLLEFLDLSTIDVSQANDPSLRPKVLNAARQIVSSLGDRMPAKMSADALIGEIVDEAVGLGPLERFLSDPTVTEIMVVDPSTIYVEQKGRLTQSEVKFTDDERVRAVVERIVTPLGRRIDESSPLVDARLKDGSRVNAVIRPIALRGTAITIRKFSKIPLTLDKLVTYGSLLPEMGKFLVRSVIAKRNIVVSGGTGSGKTTLLNVLSGAIPSHERIVTIEDAAELQLQQPHVVSLETRPANMEGKGEYSIRDLVKNALRMRPDRIVIGECRGGEALDMLQAMNTGHDGSLTTTHANSPREAIARIETLVLMAGVDLPVRAIREQIASSVHLVVQQSRLSDGSRKVTAIHEVVGMDDDGTIALVPIYEFARTDTGPKGEVLGEFRATGFLPSFLNEFVTMGLVKPDEAFL